MEKPEKYRNYINGTWKEPESREYCNNYNPADEKDLIGLFPLSSKADVEEAVLGCHKAFQSWHNLQAAEREIFIYRFLKLLEEKVQQIGEAICREEGKILKDALGEPKRGIEEISFFIGEGRRMEGITMPSDRKGVTSVAQRVPLGVIAAITPWNFPFLTPLRKIIPALVTGNTVIFKPASETPLSAVLLMELFEKAELPPGVVNLVMGSGRTMGDAITSHPLVRGISFTGSTAVGRSINRNAAENFTRVQLEMGGKNPAVVADYSDLDRAAAQITSSAFALSGQRCTAISRVIVFDDIADELEEKIAVKMSAYVPGRGMNPEVSLGPVINRNAGEKIMNYIRGAEAAGAKIKAGGKQITGGIFEKGFYIEPTLITGVTPDMAVAREEIFGPVLVSIRVKSFQEAIEVANSTPYGLSASLFTDSLKFINSFQEKVETGMTHVNHGTVTDSAMPFGGVKESGLGPFSKGKTNKDFFTTWKVNYLQMV